MGMADMEVDGMYGNGDRYTYWMITFIREEVDRRKGIYN